MKLKRNLLIMTMVNIFLFFTKEINKLTADNFAAWLKQTKFASKNDIADFIKKAYLGEKLINTNKKAKT